MRDVGLADRIEAKGLNTVRVAGFETRGGELAVNPLGAGMHHTAGAANGVNPSYNTVMNGRPADGLPGPLCNVLQGRHASNPFLDPCFVIAAGKANHGGVGEWLGHSGNSLFEGLEVEHTGLTTVNVGRLEVSARILAAMCEAPGSQRSARWVWQHFEYARPHGRKIDFNDLSPWSAAVIRDRTAYWIGRTAIGGDVLTDEDKDWLRDLRDEILKGIVRQTQFLTTGSQNSLFTPGHPLGVQGWIADSEKVVTNNEIAVQLTQAMAEDQPILVKGDTADWWVIDGNTRSLVTNPARADERVWVGDLYAKLGVGEGAQPWPWPQALIDSIPRVDDQDI